jgi:hypothetical protein
VIPTPRTTTPTTMKRRKGLRRGSGRAAEDARRSRRPAYPNHVGDRGDERDGDPDALREMFVVDRASVRSGETALQAHNEHA